MEEEAFAEKNVEVVKIIGEGPQQHEVQLDAPLQLCSNFCCKEIKYRLAFIAAADGLMASSKKVLLPKKYSVERLKADQLLYNDVLDLLASWNVGWGPDSVQTVGECCVKT